MYHVRIAKAIAFEKQRLYDDSLKGTIPITVILLANLESKNKESTPVVMGTLKLQDSPNKQNYLGEIVGNWNIEGLCNQGKRLCLGSVTNNDGTYSSNVLPLKLKRGEYQFYAENDFGNIQQEFSVKVPVATSLYFYFKKMLSTKSLLQFAQNIKFYILALIFTLKQVLNIYMFYSSFAQYVCLLIKEVNKQEYLI